MSSFNILLRGAFQPLGTSAKSTFLIRICPESLCNKCRIERGGSEEEARRMRPGTFPPKNLLNTHNAFSRFSVLRPATSTTSTFLIRSWSESAQNHLATRTGSSEEEARRKRGRREEEAREGRPGTFPLEKIIVSSTCSFKHIEN